MQLKIRKFNKKEIDDILRLENNFPPKSREKITKDEAERLYKKNPNACLVAEYKNKIVGAIFAEVKNDECKIRHLIIDIDYLGEGIATTLIEEVMKATNSKKL
jgi:ribosomal protein S18 acetylase RimI-like enzyme